MASSFVGARSIEELAAALKKQEYTPLTEEERRKQAETYYKNQLDQALLSAQQSYDTSDAALQAQYDALATAYDRQIREQQANTASAISQADRAALMRGMQRSSYNLQNMANIQNKGNVTLNDIQQQRTNDENSIMSQRSVLANQLAQNLAAAQSEYQTNVLNRMNELESQDYERQLAADTTNLNTQLQLYNAYQSDAQLAEQARATDLSAALSREELAEKIREFDETMAYNRENASGSSSGGGGGTRATTTTTTEDTTTTPETTRDYSGAFASILANPIQSTALANNISKLNTALGVASTSNTSVLKPSTDTLAPLATALSSAAKNITTATTTTKKMPNGKLVTFRLR